MKANKVFQVMKEQEGKIGTIYLYGYIGQYGYEYDGSSQEGLQAADILKVVKELKDAGCTQLNVRINSPGGNIMEGDGIMSAMKNSKMELHTFCDGTAASYAFALFLSAKKENRHIAQNGKLMVHDARSGVYGNAKTLRTAADNLDVFNSAAINQIVADTEMSIDDIKSKYFDGEDHWMDANTALEIGLINQIDDYEAEATIPNAEQMSHPQLVQFFAQTGKIEKNIFSKVMDKVRQQIGIIPNLKIELVNIETIKEAMKKGEITVEQLATLTAAPAPTPPTPPAEVPTPVLTTESVAEMISAALTPVQAENTDLKAEIETLKKAPGAAPSQVAAPGGEPGETALSPVMQALQADLQKDATAAQSWNNPFSRKNR